MKLMWKSLSSLLSVIILFSLINTKGYAAELKFAVTAVIPDNQIDKSQTYFDLKMKPGQKQTIQVELENATAKDIVVETYANTATTNDNGITDYSVTDPQLDKTLKIPFSEITTVEKETKVPANSTVSLDVTIEMPEETYDGVILGGLYFKEKETNKKVEKSDDVQIENKFAYTIGVLLRETDKIIKPDMELNKIQPGQINGRNVVVANLQNTQPAMLKNLSVDAEVYKEKGKAILHSAKGENLRMAPNSNFNYSIDLENSAFKPGTYRLEMKATDGDQIWKWSKKFIIEGKEAKELNSTALEAKTNYTLYYLISGFILLLLLLVLVYRLGKRSRMQEEDPPSSE